ncbi:hypothetical protein J2R91_007057 [Bradyrhizobium japonicum]|nr:hypothetical protein [Bradyrhizobium japonicum]MCP1956461.1 hypothetical protein [Bradyrhizobium japonicum]
MIAEVNNAASRVYAVEGSCFVLAPCATVSQAMIDELCDRPDKNALGDEHALAGCGDHRQRVDDAGIGLVLEQADIAERRREGIVEREARPSRNMHLLVLGVHRVFRQWLEMLPAHDVIGARTNGMTAIGVLYGYGHQQARGLRHPHRRSKPYFERVFGSELDGTRVDKRELCCMSAADSPRSTAPTAARSVTSWRRTRRVC